MRIFGAQDPFDPAQNVLAGIGCLSHLLDRFDDNLRLALAAFQLAERLRRPDEEEGGAAGVLSRSAGAYAGLFVEGGMQV